MPDNVFTKNGSAYISSKIAQAVADKVESEYGEDYTDTGRSPYVEKVFKNI